MEQADTIIQIPHFYGSLKGMQNKFDKYARQDAFTGSTREEWESWKETSRETLKDLLGWKYMETCDLDPRVEEVVELENGIRREKVIIQVLVRKDFSSVPFCNASSLRSPKPLQSGQIAT